MLPLDPAHLPQHLQKAQALLKASRVADAKALLAALAEVAPKRPEVHLQLAAIARRESDMPGAIGHLRDAQALRPEDPAILTPLASLLSAAGEGEAAVSIYDQLIAAAPRNPKSRVDKALALQRMGDFEAAEAELLAAQKLDPLRGEPYRLLAANRKLKADDPLIGKMRAALSNPKTDTFSRVQVSFAMAKAMEDTGQHDKVFGYLNPANVTMKKSYAYRVADRRAEVDGLIAAFRGHDFTPPAAGAEDIGPIFVTGLPRSGTTLVEQILASHSQVTAGGEMTHALRLAYGAIGAPERRFRPMSEISPERIARLGRDYEAALRGSVSFDRIITDKGTQAYLVMGLLRQALPGAQFIVVRRDPRDLLFSIYKNMFAPGTHRYAYDLEDLAGYYATFLKILDFWREALPGGFHEVHYEDLVADPDAQTRALVAAAGLDWEDACLNFHESGGAVKTLSAQQVRQPIYRSSAQAWRRYEADLAPLAAALKREGVVLDGAE